MKSTNIVSYLKKSINVIEDANAEWIDTFV